MSNPLCKELTSVATVTQDVLSKTPRWKKDAEHPPLSPRKAIMQANAVKNRLVEPFRNVYWFLDSAAIVQLDKEQCYWRVQYKGYSTGGVMLTPYQLNIVVLIDKESPSIRKSANTLLGIESRPRQTSLQ